MMRIREERKQLAQSLDMLDHTDKHSIRSWYRYWRRQAIDDIVRKLLHRLSFRISLLCFYDDKRGGRGIVSRLLAFTHGTPWHPLGRVTRAPRTWVRVAGNPYATYDVFQE